MVARFRKLRSAVVIPSNPLTNALRRQRSQVRILSGAPSLISQPGAAAAAAAITRKRRRPSARISHTERASCAAADRFVRLPPASDATPKEKAPAEAGAFLNRSAGRSEVALDAQASAPLVLALRRERAGDRRRADDARRDDRDRRTCSGLTRYRR